MPRVLINGTGCPAPVSDRTRMKSHSRMSQLVLPLWTSLFAFSLLVANTYHGTCTSLSKRSRDSLSEALTQHASSP